MISIAKNSLKVKEKKKKEKEERILAGMTKVGARLE